MINQGTLLGRVGKIDIKNTTSGIKVANLSIITSKKFSKDGEKQEKSTWHNVTLFSKLAEITEKYVGQGDLLYIQGEMENQKYTDKNGQEKYRSYLVAHEMKLMPKTKEAKPTTTLRQEPQASPFQDDDIPW